MFLTSTREEVMKYVWFCFQLLASKDILYCGQPVAIVLAGIYYTILYNQ